MMSTIPATLRALTFSVLALCIAGSVTAMAAEGDSKRTRREIYDDLLSRQQSVESTLRTTERDLARIETWLERHQISAQDLAAIVRDREADEQKMNARTEALAELVERLRAMLQIDLDALEAALAEALAKRDLLQAEAVELADTMPVAPPKREIQQAISLEGMAARPFLLTGDRIAPFSRPYFSSTPIKVRLQDRRVVQRTRFERQSDAGSAAAAIEPGGVLYDLVTAEGFETEAVYVALWVCADAIPAYREVASFLKANDVRYTWLPDVDAPWTALEDESPLGDWGY